MHFNKNARDIINDVKNSSKNEIDLINANIASFSNEKIKKLKKNDASTKISIKEINNIAVENNKKTHTIFVEIKTRNAKKKFKQSNFINFSKKR